LDTGNGIFGLRTRDWAVLRGPGAWKLFDLARDPGELDDVITTSRLSEKQLAALRVELRIRREATVALGARYSERPELEELGADESANLAKLGYVEESDDL